MQMQSAAAPSLQVQAAPPAHDTAQLWVLFKKCGNLAARKTLIERHLNFARYVASRCYAQRARDGIAFNDYVQFAAIGLIEAVDRFQPLDGRATFETYAAHRIRGAVLNGLINLTEVNAQIEACRRVHRARLASLNERDPDAASSADFEHFADLATGMALGFVLDDLRIYQAAEGLVEDNFYADAEMRRLRDTLARLVAALPERESQIIRAHYFDDLAFDAMAVSFGISKGRISQLHKRALALLQAGLQSTKGAVWSI